MKIVLPGGSGHVGSVLARHFAAAGHEVVVLSRSPTTGPVRHVAWDAKNPGPWSSEIDGADVVINLAGRSVDCRYTAKNRQLILDSRVDSTRAVGRAIQSAARPPRVWLQSSTATIYAHRFDAPNDEASGIIGGEEQGVPETWRFSIAVAKAWESAANESITPATRKVLMRSAMVMHPDRGSIFDVLLKLVRLGLGGRAGSGRQFVSWIHERDFIEAVDFLIARDDLAGPVNLASPNPLPYTDFMRELRRAAGVPIGLPASEWMLAIGTFLLRTETELVLKSRRVIPGRLLAAGFNFHFPEWSAAAPELCERPRPSK
ncbi:MAG TPA: TIGR01777 family oxidoreductase [Planctomycetota bacterium]|nr:TIGR01777 family oxidoreductase [Planctomycetota bacterium]